MYVCMCVPQGNEVAAIMQHRNSLAASLVHKRLPPMLQSEQQCGRCFANATCALYHRVVEGGSEQSSGMVRIRTQRSESVINKGTGRKSEIATEAESATDRQIDTQTHTHTHPSRKYACSTNWSAPK